MALFDVPGWSISDEPISVVPKRRKRSSGHDFEKVSSASANVEKLMEQLVASPAAGSTPVTGKSGVVPARCDQPPKKNCKRAKGNKNRQPHILASLHGDAAQLAPGKKIKKDRPKGPIGEKATVSSSPPSRSTLTSLQHDMKQSLDGARFRYTTHSPPFPSGVAHV
jgi:ribosomal RNA-processing protein 8